MKLLIIFFTCIVYLHGTDSIESWFNDGNISGNIKYYYIETNKKFITKEFTTGDSNAIGGELKYSTSLWNGWRLAANLMTSQPFLLYGDVESSTIGQDNGRIGKNASSGFATFGELYAEYKNDMFNIWYGRRVITTPMIGAKDVRMVPSAINGAEAKVFLTDNSTLSFSYIDRFKQRSSGYFMNIIEHALGEDTKAITGSDNGYVVPIELTYKEDALAIKLYNLYASDFINTAYADIEIKKDFYTLSAQVVSQKSIGNADTNLAKLSSVTNGKKINSAAVGIRGIVKYNKSTFDIVYRNIFRDTDAYDSIITPWDGTLLYAYSSTTNNLGQSLYGKALSAGGAYVGGTQGVKFGYTQKYDFLKGFSTHIAYARYFNSLYRDDQEDLKLILSYKVGDFSFQVKGIWIDNDTYTLKDGTVNQLDWLTQYHIIAKYKF